MKAIILAAGYATRLGDLAKDTPKALLSVAGKPMLSHLVERIDKAGAVEEIVVVSNHRFYAQLCGWANTLSRGDIKVLDDGSGSPQDALGALGDFAFALERTGGVDDVFLAVGDNFFPFGLEGFFERYNELNGEPVIMARRIDDPDYLRRIAVAEVEPDGRVVRLAEKPEIPFSDVGVFGLYLYPGRVVALLPEYFAHGGSKDQPGHFPVWLRGITDVYAYFAPDEIFDVGTPDSLRYVRSVYGE